MSCYLVKVKKEEPEDSKINIKVERKSSLHHYSSSCTAYDTKPVFIKHEIKKEEYDSDCDCNDCRVAQGNVIRVTIDDVVLSTTQNQTDQHEADCGCSDCVQNDQVLDRDQANQGANQSVDLTDEQTCDNASRSSTPDWMPSIFSSDDDDESEDDEIIQDEKDDADDDPDFSVDEEEEEIWNDDDLQVKGNFTLCDNFTPEQVKQKLKSHISMKAKFKCPIEDCLVDFKFSSDLKKHMTVHIGKGHFEDTQCKDRFSQKNELNNDNNEGDNDSKRKSHFITIHFNCLDCTKPFKTKDELKHHQLKAHQIQRFRCLVKDCSASFERNKQFIQHRSVKHCNRRMWPCRDCDHQLKTYTDLAWHYRAKHQKGRFVCAYTGCTVETDAIRAMETHVRAHKPAIHRCLTSGCNKRFQARRELLEHERMHTGERPFACEHCNKRYNTNHQLKNHILAKHHNQKPFSCKWNDCHFEDGYLSSVYRHVLAHFKKAGDDVNRKINDFIERHYDPVTTAAETSKETNVNSS